MLTQFLQTTGAVKRNCVAFKYILVIAILFTTFSTQLKAQDVVDATTMNNKILAGYQGWFRTPGDRPGSTSWAHVFNGQNLVPERLALDTWPDMSEYGADEKTVVPGFNYPDGSPATMYSAQNPKTVLRHFEWMKQYGIDGVWLSEFCGSFPREGRTPDTAVNLTIMRNVMAAATATGRTWAFMWDMSSFNGRGGIPTKSDVYYTIITQWKKMVDEGVTTNPRYMHHDGKPVLLIWGFFPNRPASLPDYMNPVLDFLLAPGKYQATLVGGVDPTWRATGTPEFKAMLMRMQALQPWSVGRRVKDPATDYAIQNTTLWEGDMAMCKANNVIFQPVINAGTHIAGPPPAPPALPAVPRRMGNYLWEQFVTAQKAGTINSAFIAMFDEVNEGTQLYKITSKPPVQAPFLTYDGATNDYYLRLVGTAAKMLKNHKPITPTIPISPFSTVKWYKLKNRANGLMLNNKSKTAKGSIVQVADAVGANGEWQLLYDGNGYFKIKSRLSGKMLSPAGDAVTQVADSGSDNLKWHLEWDGTGTCRIVSKTGGKALSNGAVTTPGSPVVYAADAPESDDLRWQVIEQ